MNVRIRPGKAMGSAFAPPSKSMAHRLLIAAALSDGKSVIHHLSPSEDILATADCLRALGKTVEFSGDTAVLSGKSIAGEGRLAEGNPAAESLPEEMPVLRVRESGSTLRFLIPTALTYGRRIRFDGSRRLFERPLSVYEELAAKSGFLFEKEPGGLTVSGRLEPGVYRIPGNISSQFISGLLFALPFLKEDSRIELIPPVESRPYIDMTESALLSFGIRLIRRDENVIEVPGNQRAEGAELIVEGDCSNAAFLEVLNVFGGSVDVKGLNPETLQGDKVYPEYFRKLSEGFSELSLADCPDLGPVLFAASAALHGGCFTETERLRLKESDRVSCMAEELRKFGIRCENDRNTFTVFPGTLQTPEQKLSGHNDHRIVMALSSLLTLTGGEIEGAEAVRKSWPDYFKQLQKLGIEVEKDAVDQ